MIWRFDPEPALLLVRRAARPGDPWSQDMAFPGGFAHRGEGGRQAAIRETREEVGLTLEALLGRLGGHLAVRPPRQAFVIEPWVFAVEGDPALVLEPSEVAEAVWVPWSALARPPHWGRQSLRGLPILAPTRSWEGHRIWGLTGGILDELVAVLAAAP